MPDLFSPLVVRGLTLPNRIYFPPMAQELSTEAGEVTPALIEHYVVRARGGAGFLMLEHSYVERRGRYSPRQTGLYDDGLVPGLQRLVEAVHREGVPIGIQLAHAGSRSDEALIGEQPVAPSAVAPPGSTAVPRPLGEDEIPGLVERFVRAARRAVAAGFDVVEVHGAHGFLLSQFLSPLTNRREDAHGGDLAGRVRLAGELVAAVRAEVGELPLWFRLGADDGLAGGLTLAEGVEAGRVLGAAGVDVLDVSGGLCGSRPATVTGPGYFVPQAEAVKAAVGVPVAGVGGIRDPKLADRLVREGRVDLVAVGRAILEDPRWPEHARQAVLGVS